MRYGTAVERLRQVVDDAPRTNLLREHPLLLAVYVYGPVVDGLDDVDAVDLALVVDVPAAELTWGTEPPWTLDLVAVMRLDKAPVRWRWLPAEGPVVNHRVGGPVRLWSAEGGADEDALDALRDRRADHLRLPDPSESELQAWLSDQRAAAERHLRSVQDRFWEPAWRRAHTRSDVGPEQHLWNAVDAYLDLGDALRAGRSS